MNIKYILILLILTGFVSAHESDLIFRSSSVSEIRINIDTTVREWIYNNVESDSLHPASVRFRNESVNARFDSVGFRLRGNTSRNAAKKSFKLDFNEFIKGQAICGIQKFNLKAEQNDPSMIRSKIAFELFEQIGLKASRVAYTEVYINEKYYGLYENIEHIDDCFLEYHMNDPGGNLWKCLWPANLAYRGNNPSDYWPYYGDERPYELKTNKDAYDYSKLAHFIDIINNTPLTLRKDSLESIFRVTDFIKYLAVNIMTGSWDDYRYLQNNYYLYHNPANGRFHFIPYDYDNTFGIDWVGGNSWGEPNWTRINMYNYDVIDQDGRPLSDIIFNTPEYRNLFTHFMDFFTNNVFGESDWQPWCDSIRYAIAPYVGSDNFYPLDFGFNMDDFHDSYDTDYRNGHVERGLYEFMRKRTQQTIRDLSWVSSQPSIYHFSADLSSAGLNLDVSAFHHSGIRNVKLITFNARHDTQRVVPLTMNRQIATNRVEAFDSWIGSTILNSTEKKYLICAESENGKTCTYPRNAWLDIPDISDCSCMINEFMASNDAALADQNGEYDDWLEIYNPGDSDANISGLYLSDKPNNLAKWKIPHSTVVPAGGFLLIWCDEDGGQSGLHTNFKLSADGEFIALTDIDGTTVIDSLTFGKQETDVSLGRTSDGADSWQSFSQTTPGNSNGINDIVPILPDTPLMLSCYPNPFNAETLIDFTLPEKDKVKISIYSLRGKRICTLTESVFSSGQHKFNYRPTNLASGIYLVIIKTESDITENHKLIYLK